MPDDDLKCDFCSERPVTWSFHVFPIPIVVDTGVGVLAGSRDDWAACDQCKAYIDADARDLLAERSLATYPRKFRRSPTIMADLRHIHNQFFDLKNGPGEPVRNLNGG